MSSGEQSSPALDAISMDLERGGWRVSRRSIGRALFTQLLLRRHA